MIDKSISLSKTQLSVMRALWEKGESDTQMVCDALSTKTKTPAYTTVSTLLKRLERRGLITHSRVGRKQLFRALVSEQDVQTSMVAELIGSVFKGDSRALVSHLIKEKEIKPGDLETLQEMIKKGKKS
ncbi:MAG: BlaI/MecI/CopY family transcriptional regulator [Lysobacterales bacterium]